MKRKKIKNETEYYLVRSMLDDDAAGISGEERRFLAKMIAEFENTVKHGQLPE